MSFEVDLVIICFRYYQINNQGYFESRELLSRSAFHPRRHWGGISAHVPRKNSGSFEA